MVSLGAEQMEQSFAGQPIGQRGDLVLRAGLPQAVQQPGDTGQVAEQVAEAEKVAGGDVGGALDQRGDLLLLARLPQAVQQAGDAVAARSAAWADSPSGTLTRQSP